MSGATEDDDNTLSITTVVRMRACRSVVVGEIDGVRQMGTLIAILCPFVGGALAVLGEIRAMSGQERPIARMENRLLIRNVVRRTCVPDLETLTTWEPPREERI